MKKLRTTILIICLAIAVNAQNQTFEWVKQIGGSGNDGGKIIATGVNGDIYITGIFGGTVDFDPGVGVQNLTSLGNRDIFIQKLDANGNLIWVKQMGGNFQNFVHSMTIDANGHVYTTGGFEGIVDFNPGMGVENLTSVGNSFDIFIQKLDSNGNFKWAKQIGGGGWDLGRSITTDASGHVYTTGTFVGTVDFDPDKGVENFTSIGYSYDIFIQKLDANGNFVWTKQVGDSGWDQGSSIATDANGHVYTTGIFEGMVDFDPGVNIQNFTSAGSGFDIFIQKLDSDGNFIWAKQMGEIGNDEGNSIAIDANGDIYTTGAFWGTVDFDPNAGIQNLVSAGDDDIFVQKLDANGNFLWAKQMGGSGEDHGDFISIDFNGNVYTTGSFRETSDFDPGASVQNFTSAGQTDIFIQKLDPTGNFIWAKQMGGSNWDYGSSIATDVSDNVYTIGYFTETVDFDPGMDVQNLTSAGSGDIFIQKLGDGTVGVDDYLTTPFVVYPNPNNGQVAISFESVLNDVEVTITDVQGRLVYSSQYKNTDHINLAINRPAGVYFVEIKTPENKKTVPLIISDQHK